MTGLSTSAVPADASADAMIDVALATARVYDMTTVPDMNDVEMATAIGQLTATLNMLIAALRHRPAPAA